MAVKWFKGVGGNKSCTGSRSRGGRSVPAFELLESRQMMTAIPLPTIPSTVYNITTYGAVADGKTNDTTYIQNAINAAVKCRRRHRGSAQGHVPGQRADSWQ